MTPDQPKRKYDVTITEQVVHFFQVEVDPWCEEPDAVALDLFNEFPPEQLEGYHCDYRYREVEDVQPAD